MDETQPVRFAKIAEYPAPVINVDSVSAFRFGFNGGYLYPITHEGLNDVLRFTDDAALSLMIGLRSQLERAGYRVSVTPIDSDTATDERNDHD